MDPCSKMFLYIYVMSSPEKLLFNMQPCFSSLMNFFPPLHPPISGHIRKLQRRQTCCCCFIYMFLFLTVYVFFFFCQSRSSSVLLLSRNSAGRGDVLEAGPQRDHSICPSVASEERQTHNR